MFNNAKISDIHPLSKVMFQGIDLAEPDPFMKLHIAHDKCLKLVIDFTGAYNFKPILSYANLSACPMLSYTMLLYLS